MAKRFISTEIFDDSWFMSLSKESKLLWIYLITKCNHAGIIEYNEKLWMFHTELNSLVTLIKELGNRLISVNENKYYFIPNFLIYQYPNFPNSRVRAQDSAIKILNSFGLFKDGKLTVTKPLAKGYDNDNDNGYDNITINNKKFIKESSESSQWLETVAIQNKVKTDVILLFLDTFDNHLISMEECKVSTKDFKSHFIHWLNKQDLSNFREKVIGKTNQV